MDLEPPPPSPPAAGGRRDATLREKLAAFPGCKFDKQPVRVCALPQLSDVTERSDDEATLRTSRLRPYGVRNKTYRRVVGASRSDEGRNKCITPINFVEKSVSCLLVATIGSDDSVINDTLDRLPDYKEIHTDNVVELLAKEALRSTKTKLYGTNEISHSGLGGDGIEETRHATRFINEKIFSNSTKRVSSTDIVEDVQFVNDPRRIETISLPLEEKSKIHIDVHERATYDVQTAEDFFSHHCSQNRNGDLLISPTLAKKINETSSESSLDLDIRTPVIVDIKTTQNDVHCNLINVEIIDCLNDMVRKVCEDLENCTQYLSKEIENLCKYNDKVKEFRLKTPSKGIQDMAKATNTKQKKNTRLKLQSKNMKTVKSCAKKPNKLATENIKRMTTIIEKDSDVEKTLLKNSSPESNLHQLNDYETPLIKRKRKLYSPKDDSTFNEKTGIHISETEDDYSLLTGTGVVDKTPKTLATSYKDIEKIRRTSARNLRIRKSGINLSPRTKKNNDIFDNLKKNIEGERKIILADKKISRQNKNIAVYNFSSDSEDDDFQKIKGVKKFISTTGSVESARSSRPRKSKGRNVISYETNKEKNNKHVKRRKSKSDLKQGISDRSNEMIDERVREATTEALNTSLEIEQQHDLIPKAVEPIILLKPQMEIIQNEKDLPTRRTIRRKRPTNLSLKKENITCIDKNVSCDKEPSVRSSPLPGLIIETVQVQIHKDPEDSMNVAMLEKYKDIYNNEPLPDIFEMNTTHNLLSDMDQITYDSNLNITEELNMTNISYPVSKRLRNEILNVCPTTKKSKLSMSNVNEEIEPQVITLSEVSDAKSDKSIATLGKSPITGHGDLDESPPNTDQLKQRYESRGLETQDFNQSMKDYFNKLTKDIYEGSQSSHSEVILDKTINAKELEKSPIKLIKGMSAANMSPTISISRLSPNEIGQWLAPRFNSLFGSNQSSENDHPVRTTRSQSKLPKNITKSNTTKSSKINNRKSVISPIKIFGEVNKKKCVTPENKDYVEHIKDIVTTKRILLKTVSTKSYSSRYDLRKCFSKPEKSGKTVSSKNSTNVEYSNKTRRTSPVFEIVKKEKTGTIISDVVSGHGSSINEWFDRNEQEQRSRAGNTDLSLKDNLENVIEKLETTLTEIHHKTSKKFVSMFVDAQKHLTDLKEKRRQLYRETALDLISDIVKVMDHKFGDLERRSQDLDRQFIDGMKEKAGDVMRADYDHKRVMVSLLKEDVQTVLNHIKSGGRANL